MIEVTELSKIYSNGKGVFDISFKVEKGEVFGFLGPNGAGKTTTIRNLLGFTNPTKGSCSINGMDCRKKASQIQKTLGYVPGEIAFFDNMTGIKFMNFISDMRGMDCTKRRDYLIEFFELEPNGKIRKMSKGMKQKVALITAFMHDPEVIILDEPTSGLDPLMQRRFVQLIKEEKERGKTILMSSHIFDEVERTCDRAAIIREGKIVALENISTLKSSIKKSYFVTLSGDEDIEKIKSSGLEFKIIDENRLEIFISDEFKKLFETLSKCNVKDLETSSQTLEEIFIRFYNKEGN